MEKYLLVLPQKPQLMGDLMPQFWWISSNAQAGTSRHTTGMTTTSMHMIYCIWSSSTVVY